MSDRLSEYEEARLRTMASNEAFLASLELAPLSTSPPRTSARAGQRKPRASERKSRQKQSQRHVQNLQLRLQLQLQLTMPPPPQLRLHLAPAPPVR